jgi:hypothetical protein
MQSGQPCSRRGRPNLYLERFEKDLATPEWEIRARASWSKPLTSENQKCSVSLDLPVQYCTPTPACSELCYASQGRQMFRRSVTKSLAVARLIEEDPERAARKIVDEASGRPVRLAGSGDLLPEHSDLARYLECHGGRWWGFTRRPDTHRAMPELMFSLDATTPASILDYVKAEVPVRRRSYLRRPEDEPPPLSVAVTFPVHGARTNLVAATPSLPTDCPGTRKYVSGCWACQRCF